jgi:hypothetical protein
LEDEETRVKLAWMLWDHKMWTAAFAADHQLTKLVVPTETFVEDMTLGRAFPHPAPSGPGAFLCPWSLRPDAGNADQEKFRITYEAMQIIYNWFDADK